MYMVQDFSLRLLEILVVQYQHQLKYLLILRNILL